MQKYEFSKITHVELYMNSTNKCESYRTKNKRKITRNFKDYVTLAPIFTLILLYQV